MTTIEHLGTEMIQFFLVEKNLHFLTSPDGTFVVPFEAQNHLDRGVRWELLIEGSNGTILVVRVRSDQRFADDRRAELHALCSEWSNEHRWPKVYVHERPTGTLEIVAEGQLETAGVGVHQGLVSKFCEVIGHTGLDFFGWILGHTVDMSTVISDADLAALMGEER